MSWSIQQRGTRHQLRVTHALLPRPFFSTFDTRPEAETYRDQLLRLLAAGVVPEQLLQGETRKTTPLLVEVIRGYTKAGGLAASDAEQLGRMLEELAGVRVAHVTFSWAEEYVRKLKAQRLAPSSIRKRVGALGRVLDWHIRQSTPAGEVPQANVMRMLRKGYSAYTRAEAEHLVAAGKPVPRDVERDRVLAPGEEARIRAALAGQKREDRERALEPDRAFQLLFGLILNTGMRLREAYTLRVDQVDLAHMLLRPDGTKGAHGATRPRVVPIVPAIEAELRDYVHDRVLQLQQLRAGGVAPLLPLLFPFWDGTPADLKPCTARLSRRFAVAFAYADVADLTEHDLRHEATRRWVMLRLRSGAWAYSEVEICKIMGWRDTKMFVRYASLRGEDLAARLR